MSNLVFIKCFTTSVTKRRSSELEPIQRKKKNLIVLNTYNALVRNQVKAMLIGRKKEYYYFFMREYFIIPCVDIYNIVSKKKDN